MKLGNAGGAKAPCSDANVQSGKSPGTGASLSAPLDSVRTLQSTLRAKAKSEAAARFYSLWDKVYREDVLSEAYRRCRANRGAPGVDGESFEDIEANGLANWLLRLRQELRTKQYRCAPLLRTRRLADGHLHGASSTNLVAKAQRQTGNGVPPILRPVPLREVGTDTPDAVCTRPLEREGLMCRKRAGCVSSARPVR
jgi:hypothetical protein